MSGNQGGGNRVIQIDPAAQTYRVYDLQDPAVIAEVNAKMAPLPGQPYRLSESGPHGIAFDFESHLNPRVWFTQEQGQLFSYIDLATNKLYVYDLRRILEANGITFEHADPHAIAVDRRGVVWITDQDQQRVYEFDTRGGSSLDTGTARLIVHEIPDALKAHGAGIIGPHGIDVVVSDQTGQATVYITEQGTGDVIRLVPALDAARGDTGGDTWTRFQLTPTDQGLPLFVTIDTNETPNTPEDDRIFWGEPGFLNSPTDEFVRMIDLRTGTITTWQIPRMPGGNRGTQPNQTYVDREGNVFFIDRSYGVARLDANASFEPGHPALPSSTVPFTPQVVQATPTVPGTVSPVEINLPTFPVRPLPLVGGQPGRAVANRSLSSGLDQYDLRGPNAGGRGQGQGPFRGTINAGNVLYASLTQSDQFATVVFADSARRDGSRIRPRDAHLPWRCPAGLPGPARRARHCHAAHRRLAPRPAVRPDGRHRRTDHRR